MTMQTAIDQDYERILINIVRTLPLNRAEQLVDFARFLAAQRLIEEQKNEETITEIKTDNAQWDALLASDASQTLLANLANEALAEHRSGKTKRMVFNEDGRIVPG